MACPIMVWMEKEDPSLTFPGALSSHLQGTRGDAKPETHLQALLSSQKLPLEVLISIPAVDQQPREKLIAYAPGERYQDHHETWII